MFTNIEKILVSKFDQMPVAVRVITYLIILLLFVYLILSPKFIDGKIVAKVDSGGYLDYRDTQIRISMEGRQFEVSTTNKGYWSIPLMSLIPHKVVLDVLHQDKKVWYPVIIKATEILSHRIQGKDFRIVIDKNDPYVFLETRNINSTFPLKILEAIVQLFGFKPSTAYAGELNLPPSMWRTPDPFQENYIRETVFNTVSKFTGVPTVLITEEFPLFSNSTTTYIQQIQIVNSIENEFKFIIPDEHWKNLESVAEIVDYVQKRVILQDYMVEQGLNTPSDWPSIQQSFPSNQIPIFTD